VATTLTVYDQQPGATRRLCAELQLPAERITARALIRRRVRADVESYNQTERARLAAELSRHQDAVATHNQTLANWTNAWLVVPGAAERALNGDRGDYGPREAGKPAAPVAPTAAAFIDIDAFADEAFRAFARNGFFMIFDGRQITDLDEVLTVERDSALTFVRLVPLVGG
jgi:hypothetical protein